MPIIRTLQKNAVLRAMFYGTLTGLISVILFIAILRTSPTSTKEMIAVSEQPENDVTAVSETFYAMQHGVFSSEESAAQFMAGFPQLNIAAIIEVDDYYFVWSKFGLTKESVTANTNPSSFSKAITFSSSCPEKTLQQLPHTLKNEKWLKFSFEEGQTFEELPEGWELLIPQLTKLSSDTDIIRLQAFNHYYSQLDCLKVQF